MIKQIVCFGCDSRFDTRVFITHVPDCRWSNNVPVFNMKELWKEEWKSIGKPNFGLGNVMKNFGQGAV